MIMNNSKIHCKLMVALFLIVGIGCESPADLEREAAQIKAQQEQAAHEKREKDAWARATERKAFATKTYFIPIVKTGIFYRQFSVIEKVDNFKDIDQSFLSSPQFDFEHNQFDKKLMKPEQFEFGSPTLHLSSKSSSSWTQLTADLKMSVGDAISFPSRGTGYTKALAPAVAKALAALSTTSKGRDKEFSGPSFIDNENGASVHYWFSKFEASRYANLSGSCVLSAFKNKPDTTLLLAGNRGIGFEDLDTVDEAIDAAKTKHPVRQIQQGHPTNRPYHEISIKTEDICRFASSGQPLVVKIYGKSRGRNIFYLVKLPNWYLKAYVFALLKHGWIDKGIARNELFLEFKKVESLPDIKLKDMPAKN